MAHLRATLIALHIVAVLALSLPSSRLLQRHVWDLPSNQRAFAALAERLTWLGIESTKDFDTKLWNLTKGYVRARNSVTAPFRYYADLAGVRQGWGMFSRPRERPVELQIGVADAAAGFSPVYKPLSREYDFLARELRQYRFRKVASRLARHFHPAWYDPLTRILATNAAIAYPDGTRVRVRLYRYSTLPPAQVKAGDVPEGRYQEARIYQAEELR